MKMSHNNDHGSTFILEAYATKDQHQALKKYGILKWPTEMSNDTSHNIGETKLIVVSSSMRFSMV